MDTGLKFQFLVIAASGLVVAILGGLLAAASQHLTPGMMRYFLPIPPLSVAAFSFVFAFLRDRGGDSPGMTESLSAVASATLISGLCFALISAGILILARLGARFL